jgi:hypothetical protein
MQYLLCGDRLIKILLITLIPWLVSPNAEMRSRLPGPHETAARVVQPD